MTNRLYYNPANGEPHYIISGEKFPADGAYIEVSEIPPDLTGYRVIDGQLVLVDLGPLKEICHSTLLRQVKTLREPFVTALPGQDMIYLRKEQEAIDWINATAPVLADYPLLSAEVGITAPDANQLAQIWLNMSAMWREAAAQLEQYRLGTAAVIDAATTLTELEALGLLPEATTLTAPEQVVVAPPTPEDPIELMRRAATDRLDQMIADLHARLNEWVFEPTVEQRAEVAAWFALPEEPTDLSAFPLLEATGFAADAAPDWFGVIQYRDQVTNQAEAIRQTILAQIAGMDGTTDIDAALNDAADKLMRLA